MTSSKRVNTDSRPLLILDIDETLLFASTCPLDKPYDYKAQRTWIYKRPYVDIFLHFCMKHFQIAVWTSARACYAEEIFSNVFAYLPLVFIHSEQHCVSMHDENNQTVSVKPLRLLTQWGFTLDQIIMIDDSKEKHVLNPDNLILVKPYYANNDCNELSLLKDYLNNIKHKSNFLNCHNQHWHRISSTAVE